MIGKTNAIAGEVWEEVDLANFPTDWVEGDRIKVSFNLISLYPSVSSWTSSIPTISSSDWTINTNQCTPPIEFIVGRMNTYTPVGYGLISFDSALATISVSLNSLANLNTNYAPFEYWGIVFNANAVENSKKRIYREDLSEYVYKIWRLKR